VTLTLDSAVRVDALSAPKTSVSWRTNAFLALLVFYVLLTLGIIYRSPVLTLDSWFYDLRLRQHSPGAYGTIDHYVMLGQRAPSTAVALPWIVWRAWRARSARPLVMLVTALVVLNLSVGVVKTATARLGPLYGPNVHAVFTWNGNIFPSGHVSNAVVLYGVLAWISVKHRRSAVVLAAFVASSVGMGTVYLNTHWFSDVVGGWAAGGLVLLALPWLLPTTERWWAAASRQILRRLRRRGSGSLPPGGSSTEHLAPQPDHQGRTRPLARTSPS
jgi:membrane-associated phospholipid phosphatase